ncbi:MAG: hypothetical protein AB7T86_04995 [Xanthobacteraceae bacterium]
MSKKEIMERGAGVPSGLEARLAALRRDVIASEERAIRLGCAKTNETYIARFKRKAEGEFFTVTEIAKEEPPKPQGGIFGVMRAQEAVPESQRFNWDEFDFDEACPGCGIHSGLTNCANCGRQMCRANARDVGGRRKFFCHPSCGASFFTTPATSVSADTCSKPALPSPEKCKALEAPRLRLSGPRK